MQADGWQQGGWRYRDYLESWGRGAGEWQWNLKWCCKEGIMHHDPFFAAPLEAPLPLVTTPTP